MTSSSSIPFSKVTYEMTKIDLLIFELDKQCYLDYVILMNFNFEFSKSNPIDFSNIFGVSSSLIIIELKVFTHMC